MQSGKVRAYCMAFYAARSIYLICFALYSFCSFADGCITIFKENVKNTLRKHEFWLELNLKFSENWKKKRRLFLYNENCFCGTKMFFKICCIGVCVRINQSISSCVRSVKKFLHSLIQNSSSCYSCSLDVAAFFLQKSFFFFTKRKSTNEIIIMAAASRKRRLLLLKYALTWTRTAWLWMCVRCSRNYNLRELSKELDFQVCALVLKGKNEPKQQTEEPRIE